ncbi:hypothetical protein [Microbispora sp. GKU 823]|uniref:hypothetical protein n=1 Tax=Microbispora sp. GKU 823 TaxID=1652100 RepID=UPI00118176C7|nr:hypothetical protein [Microbispora sp. GKU 823]
MKRTLLGLATATIAGLAVTAPVTLMAGPASAGGDFGPNTCLEGYVWREARTGRRRVRDARDPHADPRRQRRQGVPLDLRPVRPAHLRHRVRLA